MQTVYVDVFVFVNMFEEYLLILGVKYILRLKSRYYRIIIASFVSSILSAEILLPFNNFFTNMLFVLLSSALAVLISFGYNNRKLYFKTVSTLIVLTLLFSGAMIFLYMGLKPDGMMIINNRPYFDISPVLLIILTVIIYFILFLYKKFFRNKTADNQLHRVSFLYQNNKCSFNAKTDSGCNLKEPFSGSSVIIVEEKVLKFTVDKKLCRVIPFDSLGGNGIIFGFKADEVYIDDIKCNEEIYIGIYDGAFNSEIEGLVPLSLTGG